MKHLNVLELEGVFPSQTPLGPADRNGGPLTTAAENGVVVVHMVWIPFKNNGMYFCMELIRISVQNVLVFHNEIHIIFHHVI